MQAAAVNSGKSHHGYSGEKRQIAPISNNSLQLAAISSN